MSEYKTADELAAEVKEHLDGKFREAGARLDELEQKVARGVGAGSYNDPNAVSWGAQIADKLTEAKSYFDNRSSKGSVSFEVKTLITSELDSGGDVVVPYRDGILALPKRGLTIRDLLPVVQVTTGSVEYAKMTTFTNAAASVAEGDAKAESAMVFDIVTEPIRTIAHWIPASRQILDDAPQLRGIIDTELRYGLAYVEDNMLLNGSGTGTDLNGIYTQATASTANLMVVSAPTKIDVIGAAIYQQNLTNLPADGIVLHPADWASMLLVKDTAGAYIIGNPQDIVSPRLFGLPVAVTPAMTAGKFLVGNFKGSATLYDRWSPRVEISTEHSDYFVKNKVAILCEERIGLGVKRTLGFTKGDFAAQITDLTS